MISLRQCIEALLHREFFLGEKPLRTLLAIVYDLACGVFTIHMVSAEGEHSRIKRIVDTLHRMENRHRIIHHAKGIDLSAKLFGLKSLTNMGRKT